MTTLPPVRSEAPVRVLIVDDSATARRALEHAMHLEHNALTVVGSAANGRDALRKIEQLDPQIVVMDVHLGAEDGVDLAAHIMATRPLPILIVTGLDPKDPGLAFRAMQAGALDVLPKLHAPDDPQYEAERKRLVRVLVSLSRVPVVTRRPKKAKATEPSEAQVKPRLVCIGASTGGPPLLEALLSVLPRPFPLPIAIVQHIAEGFADNLGHWLAKTTGHRVLVCDRELAVQPGTVYVASDRFHMRLLDAERIAPLDAPPRRFQKPCIDIMFESAAAVLGRASVGVILSGMAQDGAQGLLELRRKGALTIAQDPSSCVVDSMPRSAMEAGAASMVLAPVRIAALLTEIATS